jgi:molybdopterin-biosynthesis enzyme MoeA-like protein
VSFGLIIIGDEILSGRRQDKHLPRVIEMLGARGHALAWARLVGDEREHIVAVLREALGCGDIVFCCGGIGATPDDHTRQAAAQAAGRPLRLHPEAKALIERRMHEMAVAQGQAYDAAQPDNVHRLNMGVFPEGAEIIPNPYNGIPGFSLGTVHFLPGFPVMAHPMIEWLLDTRYAGLKPRPHAERALYVSGSMEATLTPLMEAIETEFPAVKVFSLPSVDHPQRGRHIELGVKGEPVAVEAAYARLQRGLAALAGVQFSTE